MHSFQQEYVFGEPEGLRYSDIALELGNAVAHVRHLERVALVKLSQRSRRDLLRAIAEDRSQESA